MSRKVLLTNTLIDRHPTPPPSMDGEAGPPTARLRRRRVSVVAVVVGFGNRSGLEFAGIVPVLVCGKNTVGRWRDRRAYQTVLATSQSSLAIRCLSASASALSVTPWWSSRAPWDSTADTLFARASLSAWADSRDSTVANITSLDFSISSGFAPSGETGMLESKPWLALASARSSMVDSLRPLLAFCCSSKSAARFAAAAAAASASARASSSRALRIASSAAASSAAVASASRCFCLASCAARMVAISACCC